MSRTRLFAALGFAVLLSCHNRAKEEKALFDQAEAKAREAVQKVKQVDLEGANVAFQQADTLATELRAHYRRSFDDETLPPGPEYLGKTVEAWQAGWRKELRDAIELNFDQLAEAAKSGKIDWSDSRGFIDTYGAKDIDERWLTIYEKTEVNKGERLSDNIVFVCWCPEHEEYCAGLQQVFAKRALKPLVEGLHISSEARAGAWGVIDIKAQATGYADYVVTGSKEEANNGQVGGSLPTGLELELNITTNHGHKTNWDGAGRMAVKVEMPDAISGIAPQMAANEQWRKLTEKMAQEVQKKAAQAEQ